MSLSSPDIKSLWALSAGRCSMPDCRKDLIPESQTLPSGGVVIGEHCHIVSGADIGPRSGYPIDEAEIDRYPNLILLCRNHHKMVDSDVIAWPVEKLRQIKFDHENWIQSTINRFQHASDVVYTHLVASAEQLLILKAWSTLTDNAVRNLAHQKWIDGMLQLNLDVSKANLPGKQASFEFGLKNLAQRAYQYANHYQSLAYLPRPDSQFYQEDKTWKASILSQETYKQLADRSDHWQQNNYRLLSNLTHALNEFSDAVRMYIDPYFYLTQGKFSITDCEGVTNNLMPCERVPEFYYY